MPLGWLFQRNKDEEEEERREQEALSSIFGGTSGYGTVDLNAPTGSYGSLEPEPEPYKRTFFDRVFAPFEAPQQTLFGLIREVDSDGFQMRDIGNAFGHGFKYFSPWSNRERVEAGEVGDILFGEDSKQWRRTTRNLAISVALDPLALVPVGKVARLAGGATRLPDAVNALKTGMNAGLEAAVGADRAAKLTTDIGQGLISKWWGVPEELQRRLQAYEVGVNKWRAKAGSIFTDARVLGGVKGQRLMAEALEADAMFYMPANQSEAKGAVRRFEGIMNQAKQLGIHEEDFLRVYSRARALDDEIAQGLVDLGVMDGKEFKELQGKHLRRMFEAFERPQDYIERVEALSLPASQRLNQKTFMAKLQKVVEPLNLQLNITEDLPAGTQRLFTGTEGIGAERVLTTPFREPNPLRDLGAKTYGVRAEQYVKQALTDENSLASLERKVSAMAPSSMDVEDVWTAARVTRNPDLQQSYIRKGLRQAEEQGRSDYVTAFQSLARDVAPDLVDRSTVTGVHTVNKFFKTKDGKSKFDVATFTNELDDFIRATPDASADALLAHVKDNMMAGIDLPPKFYKHVVSHATGSLEKVPGSAEFVDKLRNLTATPGISWYEYREKVEVIAQRAELSPELREALGEVLEFGPRLGDQANQAGRLLETRRLMDDLAGIVRKEDGSILEVAGSKLVSPNADDIVGPKVQITSNNLPDLKGMYAKPAVARALQRMNGIPTSPNPVDAMWTKVGDNVKRASGYFKMFKVVLDPVAHARNMIGNAVLADISGINPVGPNLVRAVKELQDFNKTGKLGRYMQLAEDAGSTLFTKTWSHAELDDMSQALANFGKMATVDDAYKGITGVFQRFADKGKQAAGMYMRGMGDAYEFEEQMFKLTAFMQRYDETVKPMIKAGKGVTPQMQKEIALRSAEFANKALFDYTDLPYVADFARKYGIVPFIAFPWKAVGRTADVLFSTPTRILKYPRMVRELNEGFAPDPDTVNQEIASLPEYMRENMVLRAPWDDGYGRPQYIDLSYFMPWATVKELYDSVEPVFTGESGGNPLPREGMFTPWLVTLYDGLRRNEDSLGRPIVTPGMSKDQAALQWGTWLTETLFTPSAPTGTRAQSVARQLLAMSQSSDRPRPLMEATANLLGGPRVQGGGLDKYAQPPANQANIVGEDMNVNWPGLLLTATGLNTQGADPGRETLRAVGKRESKISELQRERAKIIAANLPPEEKERRLRRVQEKIVEQYEEFGGTVRDIFGAR